MALPPPKQTIFFPEIFFNSSFVGFIVSFNGYGFG